MTDHFKIRHTRIDLGSPPNMPAAAETGEKTYLIGDLAREFAISLRTLRFYEDRGLLAPRRQGAMRIYDERDKARIGIILKAKKLGFTLTAIRGLLEEGGREESGSSLPLTLAQIDKQIAYLENERVQIEEALVELRSQRQALAAAPVEETGGEARA